MWLFRRRGCILLNSVFLSHSVIISCFSLSFMQESFNLANEFTKTFASSHKRIRTQEVNDEKKERKRRRKKKKNLTAIKKLIKLLNSPAATPKTWCSKSASAWFISVVVIPQFLTKNVTDTCRWALRSYTV